MSSYVLYMFFICINKWQKYFFLVSNLNKEFGSLMITLKMFPIIISNELDKITAET